jgi:alkylhydroperoxidase family enzyme
MVRVPYVSAEQAGPEEALAPILARRGGRLLNLDRVLLNSLPLALGWNRYLQAVRTELLLAPKMRELAICGVAVLNGADYEFEQHEPQYRRAGGTPAQVLALRDFERACSDASLFDAAERAVMHLTLEMTRNIKVTDATFAEVRAVLPDDRHVVELVGVIATYNMVSRFLVALGVEPEAG